MEHFPTLAFNCRLPFMRPTHCFRQQTELSIELVLYSLSHQELRKC